MAILTTQFDNVVQKMGFLEKETDVNFRLMSAKKISGDLTVDSFLNYRLYSFSTGTSIYKDQADSFFNGICFSFLDQNTLDLIGKQRPTLTADQYSISQGYQAFFQKYSKLMIAHSIASSDDKENAYRLNLDNIDKAMTTGDLPKKFQEISKKITRLFNMKDQFLAKYVAAGEDFLFNLFSVLTSTACVESWAKNLSSATTDKYRSCIYNGLQELIDLIEPTGELSKEFLFQISTLAYLQNVNNIGGISVFSSITKDVITQITVGVNKSVDQYQEQKKMIASVGTRDAFIAKTTSTVLELAQKFPNVVKDRSSYYQIGAEAKPLISKYFGATFAKNWQYNEVFGKFCSSVLMVVGGAAIFYGFKSWNSLNYFNKSLMITNAFLMFCDLVKYSYKFGTLLVNWFPNLLKLESLVSNLAKVLETVTVRVTTAVLQTALSAICVVVNVAIIGYLVYELWANPPKTTAQWVTSLLDIAANVVLFVCMCTLNPVAIFCGLAFVIVTSILKVIFTPSPLNIFIDSLDAEFKCSDDVTSAKCKQWALQKASDPNATDSDINEIYKIMLAEGSDSNFVNQLKTALLSVPSK